MAVSGWFVSSAKIAGFHQPEEKQRGPHETEGDPHERRGDCAQRKQIDENPGTETGHDGLCRFTPRKIVGALHDSLDRGRRSLGLFSHCKQGIAARRAAACIESTAAHCIRIAQPFLPEKSVIVGRFIRPARDPPANWET